ncbi:hypothetical protein PC116_g18526 [Phytophthora cactorum]|nr:hypothetical protein PC116_g18526 [Phytophthora cactorum]
MSGFGLVGPSRVTDAAAFSALVLSWTCPKSAFP